MIVEEKETKLLSKFKLIAIEFCANAITVIILVSLACAPEIILKLSIF